MLMVERTRVHDSGIRSFYCREEWRGKNDVGTFGQAVDWRRGKEGGEEERAIVPPPLGS